MAQGPSGRSFVGFGLLPEGLENMQGLRAVLDLLTKIRVELSRRGFELF
jgi:hypothetical protein